jgi:biopolymer transport protein ExbD
MRDGPMIALLRPRPQRRSRFILTPLVDVMFLLLIFFMLSSQTAPYFLLPVTADAAAPAQAAGGDAPARAELVVSVGDGYARLNGERVAFAALPESVARAIRSGFSEALVTAGPTATAQDLVTVLDAFRRESFAHVRLVPPQAPAP